jgi:hypothetical protein
MTQLRDAIRHVGRTVVLVDRGEETPAHVLAAGVGGLSVSVDGATRFISPAEFTDIEIDADVDRLVAR